MKIEKIVKPEQNIVSINTKLDVSEMPEYLSKTFMKLVEYIQSNGATILSTPFVAYKNINNDFSLYQNTVELEVGFPIDKVIGETNEIKSYILKSYKAICTLYTGKYEDMIEVYTLLYNNIKKVDGNFLNLSYEYYLSDEDVALDQQETIIELVYK